MTSRRPFLWTSCLLSVVLFGAPPVSYAGTGKHVTSRVMVVMTDGVKLATEVLLPGEEGPYPVVLTRSPYGTSFSWLSEPLLARGFAVVLQNVRGMGGSEGQFIPFIFDKQDGLDTLDWIAKQPWSDGSIGMWGSSYLGYCALILAPEKHPNLKTIVNISGWGNTSDMTMPGGAMHLMAGLPWTLSGQIRGKGSFNDFDWDEVFKRVPVTEIPAALGIQSDQWEGAVSLFSSETLDESAGIAANYKSIDIPILHMTGWYDFICRNTLDVYEGVADAARRDGRQAVQKLVVGPWRHDQIWLDEAKIGDEDFGPKAVMGGERAIELSADWFARHLRGKKAQAVTGDKVKLFVMGPNEWRTFEAWPPKNAKFQQWRFDSAGHANSLHGDGALAAAPPTGAASDTFVFDPMKPVPTFGGANMHFFLDNLGIKDQREIEKREDVLVYTSKPLTQDLEIIGPLEAVVYASSEGKQTDFTAKLVEVRADGYARIIEDGIRRGPDPIDGQPVVAMEPGRVYKFTIDLGATAIRIKKGHRVRVEVSSSNFPKYSRNPNTGEFAERASKFISVKQRVHHSADYPSHIVLPTVP